MLIGTPKTSTGDVQIENILTQLRERQIAEEKKITYQKQQSAAESEKSLREAQAMAEQQSLLTKSKIEIEIAGNSGAALASKAEQEANQIIALAKANSEKIRLEGEAQAAMESSIGLAKAKAIDAQVKAYGGAEYRVIQEVVDKLADAIKNSKVDIVPKTVVNMGASGSENTGSGQGSSTVMDTLLKFITLDKLGVSLQHISEPSTTAQAIEAAVDAAKAGAEEPKPQEATSPEQEQKDQTEQPVKK